MDISRHKSFFLPSHSGFVSWKDSQVSGPSTSPERRRPAPWWSVLWHFLASGSYFLMGPRAAFLLLFWECELRSWWVAMFSRVRPRGPEIHPRVGARKPPFSLGHASDTGWCLLSPGWEGARASSLWAGGAWGQRRQHCCAPVMCRALLPLFCARHLRCVSPSPLQTEAQASLAAVPRRLGVPGCRTWLLGCRVSVGHTLFFFFGGGIQTRTQDLLICSLFLRFQGSPKQRIQVSTQIHLF